MRNKKKRAIEKYFSIDEKYSHVRTGEGVNLCMQKIAADLLGIRLSKQEQEQQQAVVR